MIALRNSRNTLLVPYGCAALILLLGSTSIGYQDIAALMAQQAAAGERLRERLIASPFGTIHAATFSLPQPVGTQIPVPDPVRLARFNADPDATSVNRSGKGDLNVPRLQVEIMAEILREDAVAAEPQEETDEDLAAALRYKPFRAYDISLSLEARPQVPPEPAEVAGNAGDPAAADASDAEAMIGVAQLFFNAAPMNIALPGIEPWEADEIPVVMTPPATFVVAVAAAPSQDPQDDDRRIIGAPTIIPAPGGERRAQSPADQLRLAGGARAKAVKCLANAVYFEARSEPVRGQVAVAQVVLNRAFSGYYPGDVCGVVYQNAHRHLSCQFTFACDGIPDVVTEPEHWQRALRIANATLDGKVWLADVGKATHYHASYVYPYWVRSMRKHKKIGLHTFYRPRKWGDGEEAPSWGTPANAEIASSL